MGLHAQSNMSDYYDYGRFNRRKPNPLLKTPRSKAIFFAVWLTGAVSILSLYANRGTQYTRIAEIGICPAESTTMLSNPVVVSEHPPNVCGLVTGNSRRNVDIVLYREYLYQPDEFVSQWGLTLNLGEFSAPVTRQSMLEPGDYVVSIEYGRLSMGKAHFAVAELPRDVYVYGSYRNAMGL